ncbi:DUF3221 domain-containing protein [Paenibacillus xylanivorans]|uniref:DUF3221 domain-containing protein n=1 Tax=Paenibacillus xylanivorans TaxID=1705561 RepID=A0A0M9BHU4_9BACL|nr:DUF3221 domain-containing protein [Paenibacillus xylanivorans]KOY12630.1 hypothetical protein AMS66_29930 [Paenibacillus xylanivorans]
MELHMFNLRIVLISFSVLITCLTGCTGQDECETYVQAVAHREEGFTGYVVDRKEDSILVVDPVYEDFSANGGADRYYPAKWFSNAPDPQIGSYVEVWTDGGPENEPYPGQARAEKIDVSCPATPEGAQMSETDAIRGGLYSSDGKKVRIPVIEDVNFDENSKIWTIRIRDAMSTTDTENEIDVT